MKAAAFKYLRPASLDQALQALADHGQQARVLAGGQSLLPMMALRVAQPGVLIDIGRIARLRGIVRTGGSIRIGALTRHAELLADPLVQQALPLLHLAPRHIAHAAIRNRGTLGGSLALADPAAELPACALALGATIHIAGPEGEREVAARDFFQGLYTTALHDDEILTAVTFPAAGADERVFLDEVSRRRGDYAIAGLAAIALGEPGVRLAFFGCGDRPLRSPEAERLAADCLAGGAMPGRARLRQALQVDLDPPSDLQGAADTRLHLAAVLVERALASWRSPPR